MSHYTRITANSDTIVINLSQYLYDAGKTESMVIGHSTEANPNLPSTKRKKGMSQYITRLPSRRAKGL